MKKNPVAVGFVVLLVVLVIVGIVTTSKSTTGQAPQQERTMEDAQQAGSQ